jgi:L-amino acid N-acyltransferase YncA
MAAAVQPGERAARGPRDWRTVTTTSSDELPDQPVVVVTQTANRRSLKLATRLGFHHVDTFEEFGAQQTLVTARLHRFKA